MIRVLQAPNGTYTIYFGARVLITGLTHRQAIRYAAGPHVKTAR